jgi:4-diphosphocytidyl-2-C-methyl-D-erythritol kinase
MPRFVRARAFAKINLTLRVLGARPDGYHDVRTVLQSVAMHDTLTFRVARGEFRIECDDPSCPTDETNLVWRAAAHVWRAAGRRGRPRDTVAHIVKRIPTQAGLGGGSSDAASSIRALATLWRARVPFERQRAIAEAIGADVSFFLQGGTALGLDRGDLLFPLVDHPSAWVTLVIPAFGVKTKDAYTWWDRGLSRQSGERSGLRTRARAGVQQREPLAGSAVPRSEWVNDLERPVAAHHPSIARLVAGLRRDGAYHAAMSGSGSAVFGLFESRDGAMTAAGGATGRGTRALVTRLVSRASFQTMSAPWKPWNDT